MFRDTIESNGLLKLKRSIYLTIIPIINTTFVLQMLLFTSYNDPLVKAALPPMVFFLTGCWVLVYKNMWIRPMEVAVLCIFGFYHIVRVTAYTDQLHDNQHVLYIFWAPLYFIFIFMVLSGYKALLFSLMIFITTLFSGGYHLFHAPAERDMLIQFFVSHIVYIVVFFFLNKLAACCMKAQLFKKMAFEDALTKIANRRMLENLMNKEIDLSQANNSPFSVIYFDIDHFKLINDTYGHEVGDQVLKEMADIVQKNLRDSDYFGRWGGEEFVIVATNQSTQQAEKLAERLRSIIEQHEFKEVGKVTASFGISTFINDNEPRAVLWRADLALYEAKKSGRNTVKVHVS